ncbi:hypothetical protein [Gemmiger sp.]
MPQAGVGALLEAAESGEIWAAKPAVCALEQPGATAGLAGSMGGCMNRVITAEREQALFRERRVDDTAISLAEKIVDTEIENVYSTPKQQNISQSHNEKFR